MQLQIDLPDNLLSILSAIKKAGGTPLVVGGLVRDSILSEITGLPLVSKDIDIEVFGLPLDTLEQILQSFSSNVEVVGKSFGVLKLWGFDFSLPRTEVKTGTGYKGFDIIPNENLPLSEAFRRRDFTINAIGYDPFTHQVIDLYGGVNDLKEGILRHVDAKTFAEDPLRVLRAMQFVARFGFSIHPDTLSLCKELRDEAPFLTKERIGEEFLKWASKSKTPSMGLQFLLDCEWLDFFPQLQALQGIEQNPVYHPEGDVWVHTLQVCDAAARIAIEAGLNVEDRTVLVLASLCHDLAKVTHTQTQPDGKITSHGHEKAGGKAAIEFLESIGISSQKIQKRVAVLIENHLAHLSSTTKKSIGKLAKRLDKEGVSINLLVKLIQADQSGRWINGFERVLTLNEIPNLSAFYNLAIELNCNEAPVIPIIKGDHLIKLELRPDKQFKVWLNELLSAQLEGKFSTVDGGIEYFKSNIQPTINLHSEPQSSTDESFMYTHPVQIDEHSKYPPKYALVENKWCFTEQNSDSEKIELPKQSIPVYVDILSPVYIDSRLRLENPWVKCRFYLPGNTIVIGYVYAGGIDFPFKILNFGGLFDGRLNNPAFNQ